MTLLKPLTSTVVHWGSKELLLAGGVLLAVVSKTSLLPPFPTFQHSMARNRKSKRKGETKKIGNKADWKRLIGR